MYAVFNHRAESSGFIRTPRSVEQRRTSRSHLGVPAPSDVHSASTVSQSLSKHSNCECVIYVGCGERGNEMAGKSIFPYFIH